MSGAKNVSTTHVRIGGQAKVTIDYGKYDVLAARQWEQGPAGDGTSSGTTLAAGLLR
jgi:hypothetical protein